MDFGTKSEMLWSQGHKNVSDFGKEQGTGVGRILRGMVESLNCFKQIFSRNLDFEEATVEDSKGSENKLLET